MVSSLKMTPWLMAVFCLVTASCSNVTDQQTSRSQQDQVAIIKQIRKVNEDGSHSFGYEAGDGSFKNIPRVNRSSTMRKPTLAYVTSAESSSSKSSVVQSIPRIRKTTTMSTTTTIMPTESIRPIFGHFIKAIPKSHPRIVINGQQRLAAIEEDTSEDSQITRPSTEEKSTAYRRIIFAKRPIDHSLQPITDEFEEKEEKAKITSGNTLRRQLHEETTKSEHNHDNVDNDNSDVYSNGLLSTARPLFTTTTPPRLLHRISALRTERPKTTYLIQNDLGPAKFDKSSKYESPRVYEETSNVMQDARESSQQTLIRGPRIICNDNREYARQQQSVESVYVEQQPEPYLREPFSTGLLVQHTNTEDDPTYKMSIPIRRMIYRLHPSHQHIYTTTTDDNVYYLTNTKKTEPEANSHMLIDENYVRPRGFYRPMGYADEDASLPRGRRRPVPQLIDDRDYPPPAVTTKYPYKSNPTAVPPELPNPIALPLSRRDFQILLWRLLVRQYGAEAFSFPRTYLENALHDQHSFPTHQSAYPVPLPSIDVAYDAASVHRRNGYRVPVTSHGYSRALNPLHQIQPYDEYREGKYAKRAYHQNFDTQEVNGEGDEILPPAIRETLLLRMLHLIMNSERATMADIMASTTVPTTIYRKTGPVRSVQIITDEDKKDYMKKET